jgi:glutamine synthetase
MPPTLLHAVEAMQRDDLFRQAFGHTGTEYYSDYFAAVKAEEFRAWHAVVTAHEVQKYLTLF